MKALVFAGLLPLVSVGLSESVRAEYAIEAAYGPVIIYPRLIANYSESLPSGDDPVGGYFALRVARNTTEIKSYSLGAGISLHPYVETIPNSGYVQEDASWLYVPHYESGKMSEEYWLDFQVVWHYGRNQLQSQLPIRPRAGLGIGLFLYREGSLQWREYVQDGRNTYYRKVTTPSRWKPLALTAECIGGLETSLSKRITLALDLQMRIQQGLRLRGYASTFLESEWIFSLNYAL